MCILEKSKPNTAYQGFRGQSALASHGRRRWHGTLTAGREKQPLTSVVNEDLIPKAKAMAKDLTFKAKDNLKDCFRNAFVTWPYKIRLIRYP